MHPINMAEETKKKRIGPHCAYCQNHQITVSTRQHQCPYKSHDCDLCQLTKQSQVIMRHQQRFWRFMNHKLKLSKARKGQLCDKCRNHGKVINKSNHSCPYEKTQCTCQFCVLSDKRRKIMKHLQKARRQGVVTRRDSQSGRHVIESNWCVQSQTSPPGRRSEMEENPLALKTNLPNTGYMDSEQRAEPRSNSMTESHGTNQFSMSPPRTLVEEIQELRLSPKELSPNRNLQESLGFLGDTSRNNDITTSRVPSPPALVYPKAIRPRPGILQHSKSSSYQSRSSFGERFPGSYLRSSSPLVPCQGVESSQSSMTSETSHGIHPLNSKTYRRHTRGDLQSFPCDFPQNSTNFPTIQAFQRLAMQERFPYGLVDPYLLRSFMPGQMTNSLGRSLMANSPSLLRNPLSNLEGMTQMLYLENNVNAWQNHAFRWLS